MSDRLAISATLSVLMMSIFVLFASNAVRLPFGPQLDEGHRQAPAAGLTGNPAQPLGTLR